MSIKINISITVLPVLEQNTNSDSNQSAIQLHKDPRCSKLWLECQNPTCARHGCLNELMNIEAGGNHELH